MCSSELSPKNVNADCISLLDEEGFAPIREALMASKTVLSLAHPFSDGDALGSQLALAAFCKAQGKRVVTLNFDPLPDSLLWVPGVETLTSTIPEGETFDLLFLMETTDASRMGDRVNLFKRARQRVHLDHHVDVPGLGDLNYLNPKASSTCEILYDLLAPWNDALPMDYLQAIYLGIMTDTGNFRFPNTTPHAHHIAAEIITRGLDIARTFKSTYEANPFRRILIHGIAMSRITQIFGGKVIYTWLTGEDFQKASAGAVDADGVINQLCSIKGAEVVLIFREQPDGKTKISFRSTGKADVQVFSRTFGGGGHSMAAGAEVALPLKEAIQKALSTIEPLVAKLGN